MKEKVVYQLDETDCAAACIASISKFYKKNISISKIRKLAGTDSKGTTGLGVFEAATKLGYSCKGLFCKDKQLPKKEMFPLILHVKKDIIDHYVVAYYKSKEKIIIADPAEGICCYKNEQAIKDWSGVFFVLTPKQEFYELDNSESIFSKFIYLLKPHKKILIDSFVAGILISILGILSSFYFRYLIDEVVYCELSSTLTIISLLYLFVIILTNIITFCRNQLMMYMSNKIDLKMIQEYIQHLLKLPIDFFSSRKTGEILSRLGDIATIRNVISSTSLSVIIDCSLLLLCGIVLLITNKVLLTVSIIPVLCSSVIAWIFINPNKKKIKEKAFFEADKQSGIVEVINGINTVKSLSIEKLMSELLECKIVKNINKGLQIGKSYNIQNCLHGIITQVGNLLLYWIGTKMIQSNILSLGQLISFVTLSQFFLGPFSRLINLQSVFQEAIVSSKRFSEIMDLEEEFDKSDTKMELLEQIYSIEFKNVNYCYGSREKVLSDVNLQIKQGEKVAFVGSSGSGKSTLIKLLLGFYKPQSGEIKINEQNIEDINKQSIRLKIGYVAQDVLLFSGTIYQNILFGNIESQYQDVISVTKKTECFDFINSQPKRFETPVGERGVSLSGGEKQRIALARVLLKNPEVIILDEATAALDGITEKGIMKNIYSLGKDITMIIVAHRLSTIINCDKIVVFDKGKIVEIGTHRELLSHNGFYTKLWESQHSDQIEFFSKEVVNEKLIIA